MREAQSLALYKASVEQNVRWQHLSRMKEVSLKIALITFLAKENRERSYIRDQCCHVHSNEASLKRGVQGGAPPKF